MYYNSRFVLLLTVLTLSYVQLAQAGPVVMSISSSPTNHNYATAKPMPLPQIVKQPMSLVSAIQNVTLKDSAFVGTTPGGSIGNPGSTQITSQKPVTLVRPLAQLKRGTTNSGQISETNSGVSGVVPNEYGVAELPYTTKRTNDGYGAGTYSVTRNYPFRAAGRLYFKIGASTYVCSASLIKPGVVVTAAHCVFNYGKNNANGWYGSWQFVPGYDNGIAPYGVIDAITAIVPTVYYNGTDDCAQYGIVCKNDVAVIILKPGSNGKEIGTTVGWLGYGWNGWGFVNNKMAQISQLGYPVALDGGYLQQRTDALGYRDPMSSNNTVIGSLQTGGSSGGPWVANLGVAPTLSSGTLYGVQSDGNTVVGVTSWGYTSTYVKQQGASPFTSDNIKLLVDTVCTSTTYKTKC